jgi:hypothetical protein
MATSFHDAGWSRPPEVLFETAGLQIGKQALTGCARRAIACINLQVCRAGNSQKRKEC